MYDKITGDDPYKTAMRIYPAVHYTMGGLWVDYNLMSTIPGLHVLGEANFSDHGANRLGASALMQGLADGYFVIPYTVANYLASATLPKVDTEHAAFKDSAHLVKAQAQKFLSIKGSQTADEIHRKVGHVIWDNCGMSRNAANLNKAIDQLAKIKDEFWNDVLIPGDSQDVNGELEKAGRVSDFIELGDLMCRDALDREESCGGHFREEYQTADGEALRNDEKYQFVSAWEFKGEKTAPERHREDLTFDYVKPSQRNYK
jgi:succinate dehydrogenase / fumarate reductase flavoprotein subunit